MKNYINHVFLKNKNFIIKNGEGKIINFKLSPFLIKSSNKEIKREFFEKLKYFLLTLTEKCPSFNLEQFQNNFKKIQFKLYKDSNNNSSVIFLRKKCKLYNLDSMCHELLHLASIRVVGSVEYCGLSESYYEYGDSFGVGLNEGYTQLLKERYFGKDKSIVYPLEIQIASIVEKIVGKDIMENCFFQADLKNLCNILKKYNLENNIRYFLNNLDKLHNCINNFDNDNIKIQKLYDNINLFLLECLKNKQIIENVDMNNYIDALYNQDISLTYTNKEVIILKKLNKPDRHK